MIDVSELVDNLVALLRDIPDLMAEVSGEADRIYAYHDQYPKRSSLPLAIHQMLAPSIMVAWQGTGPGSFGGNDVWKHQVALYLRARETADNEPPTAYYRLFRLITKGIPAAAGVSLINATVHPSCYSMEIPSIHRATDAEGLDYFEVTMCFVEIGDD